MSELFLWFYCLPLHQAAALVLCGMWLLLALHRKLWERRGWRCFLWGCLALGLLAVLSQTLLLRTPGAHQTAPLPLFASYRALMAGENPEILRSNLMNVLLFAPLGLCGCLLWGKRVSAWQAAAVTAALLLFSCAIEWAQLETGRGVCELDDLLHNTLGGLLGSLFSWLYGKFQP